MPSATTETLPAVQLQLVDRMQAIPLIELAFNVSCSTYARLKDSNQLVGWALSTAEVKLGEATRQAAPYAKKFEAPITFVDQKLCQGLDVVEEKVPIVKLPPALIIEDAYVAAVNKVAPAVQSISDVSDFLRLQASSIKNASWIKANEVLDTYYGSKALDGLTSTAGLIDTLIDKYFPPSGDELDSSSEVIPADQDKLMHTLQTIGRLPVKAARRVYARVSKQLPGLGADNFKSYMNNLLEFLRLASYLNSASNGSAAAAAPANHSSANGHHPASSTPAKSRVSFGPSCKPANN